MNAIWYIVAIYAETHSLTKVTGISMHIWRNQLVKATENGIHGSEQITPYMPQQQPTSIPVLMNRLS